MPAVLSPEIREHAGLMDQVYRRQRYIYDFTRKYYLLGRDRLIGQLALKPSETLVEVGCGTARNLIAIARRYPDAHLFGLDASEAMLQTARAAVKRAGLEHRIFLAQGLAEELSPSRFGVGSFDRVMFSYSLSMFPAWQAALAAGFAALSPNGSVHVVDFGDLAGLGRVGRRVMLAWLRLFHVTPRVEFLVVLEQVTRNQGGLTLLPGRYAFIFSGGKRNSSPFWTFDVAYGQHVPSKIPDKTT
jgi:S-adenosylmethionine-diacylgycerolhomoserine-N-methlytransferase